jgi:hypothetical protein
MDILDMHPLGWLQFHHLGASYKSVDRSFHVLQGVQGSQGLGSESEHVQKGNQHYTTSNLDQWDEIQVPISVVDHESHANEWGFDDSSWIWHTRDISPFVIVGPDELEVTYQNGEHRLVVTWTMNKNLQSKALPLSSSNSWTNPFNETNPQ